MSTRLYYSGTALPASLAPAFDAEWDTTTSAVRLFLARFKRLTAMSTINLTKGAVNFLDKDRLLRQWVSQPLAAQTISGNIKGQMLTAEDNAAVNFRSQIILRVCSKDGSTFTGTLYAGDTTTLTGDPASEWAVTTLTNRQMPRGGSIAISSTAINAGDRLVVEVGYRAHSTNASNFGGSIRRGDDGNTDLPEDETDTDQTKNPWIEFDSNLVWLPDGRGMPLRT